MVEHAPCFPRDRFSLAEIERRLFDADDTVCLDRARWVTEAWKEHISDPLPLRRAKALGHTLANMRLDIDTNPWFAGNTSSAPRAWTVNPEFGFGFDLQACIEHDWLSEDWIRRQIPSDLQAWWRDRQAGGGAGTGHLAIDGLSVVRSGLRAKLEALAAVGDQGDPDQQTYRRAMVIAMEAVIAWAHRYASAADEAASSHDEPTLAAQYRRVAEACRHVPEYPARNLFEGLQSLALVHLALVLEGQGTSISIGLPDRALACFSSEAERDPEAASDLCAAFLLKIAANSYMGRVSNTQAVTLGGVDASGADCCNGVTLAFLGGFERVAVSDPHCFLRWHPKINPQVWRTAIAMLARGRSMPMLVNDQAAVPGLMDAGIDPADAWDYCIIGCNEIGIPGRACQSACCSGLYLNDLAMLDRALRDDPSISQAEQAIDAFERATYQTAKKGIACRLDWIRQTAERKPFPLTSALMHGCISKGQDYQTGMPYPLILGAYTRGTTNAANALAAVANLVGSGRLTLAELLGAVDKGDATIRQAIFDGPRWGNDDDRVDRPAVALSRARSRGLNRAAREAGLPPILCCHVVRSLHHVDGRRIDATVDGRRPGEPLSDSIGAAASEARLGPTAMLNSVLKLDSRQAYAGLYNLNLTLPAGAQASPPILAALVEAFFADGGQELQVNVLDVAKLREARRDPGRFRDLVVRVAGFNARFVELSPLEQEEIIRRAEFVRGR